MVNRYPTTNEFVSLRDAMDQLLSDSLVFSPFRTVWSNSGSGNGGARMALPLDVFTTGDDVVITAAVPGLNPNDIEVTINQGTVTLSGQMPNVAASEEGKQATWFLHELPHGRFVRSVTLPVEIDAAKAEATFENGILRLRLPKAEQAKPQRIQVRSIESGQPAQAVTAGSEQK